MRLIDADELLRRYDEEHEGPPGNARKLIEEAPTVGGWISVKDKLCDKALQALENMESVIPCDEMCPCDWCEEHCSSINGAKKECWVYFLTEYKEGES